MREQNIHCPVCDSTDVKSGTSEVSENGVVSTHWHCQSCNSIWKDTTAIVGRTLVMVGTKPESDTTPDQVIEMMREWVEHDITSAKEKNRPTTTEIALRIDDFLRTFKRALHAQDER